MKMRFLFFIPLLLSILAGCRKDPEITDTSSDLRFSTDTLVFDTVFSSVGSFTKRFKIYNPSDHKVVISSASIGKGNASFFRMNIDGLKGKAIQNIEIGGKDSLFVFVEVTINPKNTDNPFIVTDSIVFSTNGHIQHVELLAWGQDAYFHYPKTKGSYSYAIDTINANVLWDNKKPHVVFGNAFVLGNQTLTIEEGTKVYMHYGSLIIVNRDGTLKIKGTKDKQVFIQGDRLETAYADIPSQWQTIWLRPGSKNHEINYAIIKNGNYGLVVDSLPNGGTGLVMNNTIIKNMGLDGILAIGGKIHAENTIVSNCGEFLTGLLKGGDYEFLHCSFSNFTNFGNRQTPSIVFKNYYTNESGQVHSPFSKAEFRNCIIYGSEQGEIGVDTLDNTPVKYLFDHCIVKTASDFGIYATHFKNVFINPTLSGDSTLFKDPYKGDFHLGDKSIAKDKGDPAVVVPFDFEGKARNDGKPDLGAYEK